MNSTKINENLAELYGAMIGDGCLSKYHCNYDNRERHCFLITGHTHEEAYYRQILQPILLKEFGIKGCIRFRKDCKATRFETSSKEIFNYFSELGFPIGVKGDITIPNIILKNSPLAISCIKGIFDTDGSIYQRYSKQYKNHHRFYKYLVIQFKMKYSTILEQIQMILHNNSIKTTKIGATNNAFVLRITDQNSVHKFMTIIIPHNPYHTERYLNGLNTASPQGPIAQPGRKRNILLPKASDSY